MPYRFSSRSTGSFLALALAVTLVLGAVAPALAATDEARTRKLLDRVTWITGPSVVPFGSVAQIDLPKGYRCATDRRSLDAWAELAQNSPDASQVALITADPDVAPANQPFWYIDVVYQATGYVKDDEKDQLDDDVRKAMLEVIRQATEQENPQRRRNGWPTLSIVGWQTPPFYDPRTNNLTWSLLVKTSDLQGQLSANYNSRLLGRGGVLGVNMILAPTDVSTALPAYEYLVSRMRFVSGQGYAEYRSGDNTAAYGLTALATGGTAVAVAKGWKGFAKLGVFIVAAIAGIAGAIKSVLFGRRASVPAGPASASANVDASGEPRVVKCGVCGQSNRLRADLAHPMCGKCGAILS